MQPTTKQTFCFLFEKTFIHWRNKKLKSQVKPLYNINNEDTQKYKGRSFCLYFYLPLPIYDFSSNI